MNYEVTIEMDMGEERPTQEDVHSYLMALMNDGLGGVAYTLYQWEDGTRIDRGLYMGDIES